MRDSICYTILKPTIPEIEEVGRLVIRSAIDPMPIEKHPDHLELLYLQSGRKTIVVDGDRYELNGGDLLWIFPGELHGAEEYIQNRSDIIYIHIVPPKDNCNFCMLERDASSLLWQQIRQIQSRKYRLSTEKKQLFTLLIESLKENDCLGRAHSRVLLFEFLMQVLSIGGKPTNTEYPSDIAVVIDYINSAKEEMPDIAKLASLVNLSESRFKQKFKVATGIPPIEYIIRKKIALSQSLLVETDRSITDIAMYLGFSSSQHFSILFRKYTGFSPSYYRKNTNKAY